MTRRVGSIDRRRDSLAHSYRDEVAGTFRRQQAAPYRDEHPVSVLLQLLRDLVTAVVVSAVTAFFVWLALAVWLAR